MECEEEESYRAAHPAAAIALHPESGRGISYARQQILERARAENHAWVWMLDDDLTDPFVIDDDGTRIPAALTDVLALAQTSLQAHPEIAMAGIPAPWARRSDARIRFQTNCYCCVALHIPLLLSLRYRESLRLHEDTDAALQVLTTGGTTASLERLGYQMPFPGTSAGGLAATYASQEKKRHAAEELARLWPGLVELSPGALRPHVRWELLGGEAKRPDSRKRPRTLFLPTADSS